MYNPIYKQNQIYIGEGRDTIVITGWYPAKAVVKKLDPSTYAAIGNLYSPSRGLTYLVANLAANPNIKNIVILNATKEDRNSKSNLALWELISGEGYQEGKDSSGIHKWVIGDGLGYVDQCIESKVLRELIETIEVRWSESISEVKYNLEKIEYQVQPQGISERTKDIITIPEPKSTIFPGDIGGYTVREDRIWKAWYKLLSYIRKTGILRPTGYGGQWQETYSLSVVIDNSEIDLNLEDDLDLIEFPESNNLPIDKEFLQNYIPQIVEDGPYVEGVKYSYGQRMRSWFGRDQIEQVIQKLSSEIDAASAVISLWDVEDHEKGGSPCLNHIWVRVVENRLQMWSLFRSNDMFGAWVANVAGLFYLQLHILRELNSRNGWNLQMGYTATTSLSAHIYQDCFESVDSLPNPDSKDFYDTVGDFTIEVDGDSDIIRVERLNPDDKTLVQVFSKKRTAYKRLLDEILKDCYTIDSSHSAYLGMELYRAYIERSDYEQS